MTHIHGPTGYVQFLNGSRCVLPCRARAERKRIEVIPMAIQLSWLETPTMLGDCQIRLRGKCREFSLTFEAMTIAGLLR
jgi:hypothetical protein